ncbi:MAG: NADH-quinone oxidoreductase subunit M [Actinomycetota bacterium]|jgi:NADH-quinone oxidoreductase subunit M|nr:NADH-quinone oxidoreductase subunit M [Actinomycetota bacterium]
MQGFPYLSVIVVAPVIAAVIVVLLPKSMTKWSGAFGLVVSLGVAGVAAAMAVAFSSGVAGYQMVSRHPWIQGLGISWDLGVDGISLFLVLLVALLFPIVFFGTGKKRAGDKGFVAWLLVLETACMGSFLSLDVMLFFLFFELTLVPIYFIIGGWGHEKRAYAAIKFFVYTFLGSAFLLVGILTVAVIHEHETGVLTFQLSALSHTHLSSTTGILLFLAFTAAFAVKAPLFPFHTWSPDAYSQAPIGGSVVLAAVMAKLGTYGIIRFDLNLFPRASVTMAPLLLTLGVIGIIYGAIVAASQKDLKRLVAYSSLAHLGFIVLGAFALTTQGLSGSVIEMLNHGIYTAALFLLIGMIYQRTKTWQIPRLRGLQKPAPVLAAVFTVVMLASIGLPGLNGFVGEFLVLVGTFATRRWWAVVAAIGVILSAVYMLWAYQRVFHGRPDVEGAKMREMSWRDGVMMAPLVALIVVLGIYPGPVLNRITPAVEKLVHHVKQVETTHVQAVHAAGVASSHVPQARVLHSPTGTGSHHRRSVGNGSRRPS